MKTMIAMLAVTLLAMMSVTLSGCGGEKTDTGDGSGTPKAKTLLKVAGIPNRGTEQLREEYTIVRDYLAKELDMDVQFQIVADYDAAMAALTSGQVDMCWLGGHTTVIAQEKMGENAVLVACRDLDLDFKSYFICKAEHFEALKGSTDLSKMKAIAEGKKFAFGSKMSTSGHLMPRWFMNQQGVVPEDTFGGTGVAYSGNHSNTLKAVADGSIDFGALDQTEWDKASDEVKAQAPVFYTTPGYTDYCWVANKRLGEELIGKIRAAFVNLSMDVPEQKAILEKWSAGKFMEPKTEWWDDIRAVRKELVTKKVIE